MSSQQRYVIGHVDGGSSGDEDNLATVSTSTGRTSGQKKRQRTSKAWETFNFIPGNQFEDNIPRAQCKNCPKLYMVNKGLKQIRASIDVIREWVKYVKGSESRMIVFEDCAKRSNCLSSKGLWLDCAKFKEKQLFCYEKLYGDNNVAKAKCSELRGKICDLLKVYGDSTDQSPSLVDDIAEDVDYGDDMDEFDSFGENQFLGDRTQLDEYLDDKRLKRKQPLDVLLWWKNNESRFPELAHLARDVLSIPITTVASESAFSMGGRVLNSWRSSLLPENAEALITTRNWLYGFPSDDRDNGFEVKISKDIGASSMASDSTPVSDE